MKRFMTSMLAAAAIFAISNAAQAGNSGGHGREDGRHGDGMMRHDYRYGYGYGSRHEYGRDWKEWSRRFFCREYGCYLYWCEESRWWYRYDERCERFRPLSEGGYHPRPEQK